MRASQPTFIGECNGSFTYVGRETFRGLVKTLDGSGSRDLFTNDIVCLFIGSQPEEHRLTKLAVKRPLGKLDLGNQYGFDPLASFMTAGVKPWPVCLGCSPTLQRSSAMGDGRICCSACCRGWLTATKSSNWGPAAWN